MRRVRAVAALLLLALGGAAFAGPKAYVLDHEDKWTKTTGAARLLERAGFAVKPLPLDRSPFGLRDAHLIFLASFASEHPGYDAYMKKYGDALYYYVDKGNTLVQMTQADQTEAEPPFLPTTHGARRGDRDFAEAVVLSPDHPLLEGIAVEGTTSRSAKPATIRLDETSTIWESFVDQGGFQVILAGDRHARWPALMEGAYGQGRIVLAAMAFDKDAPRGEADPFRDARRAFNERFFANLARHVVAVRARRTKPLEITPSPREATAFVDGSWTVAVLPDTQVYSLRYPGLFLMQTAWIAQGA